MLLKYYVAAPGARLVRTQEITTADFIPRVGDNIRYINGECGKVYNVEVDIDNQIISVYFG